MLRLPSFKRFSHKKRFSIKDQNKRNEKDSGTIVKKPLRINLKRVKMWSFLLFLICLIIGVYIAFDMIFRIQQIDILNAQGRPSGIESVQGTNIFLLSEVKLKDTIERNNPNITKVSVQKIYPHTIRIQVEYTSPLAYFQIANGYLLLDESAKVLNKMREKTDTLPYITYYQKFPYNSFTAGDKIDYKDILMSLHFLKRTLDLGVKITSIDINGLDMIALNAEDKRILFTTDKEQDLQVYQLETILQNFKIENKDFTSLDLRFNKPVVVFK